MPVSAVLCGAAIPTHILLPSASIWLLSGVAAGTAVLTFGLVYLTARSW